MGQKRLRIKDKPMLKKLLEHEYSLYKGTRDDRSNLEIAHDRNLARAITYSQTAISILVLGVTIVAFIYLILLGYIGGIRAAVICVLFFLVFAYLAAWKSYLSWRHHIKSQFIEEVFGGPHTWKKYGLDEELEKFRAKKRWFLIRFTKEEEKTK